MCLGVLYGLGEFADAGTEVLGVLVTTGAAVTGLMMLAAGLAVAGRGRWWLPEPLKPARRGAPSRREIMALRFSSRRRPIRRATDRVTDLLHDHDPAELFVLTIGLVIVAAAPFMVVMFATPSTSPDDLPVGVDQIQQAPPGVVDYTNIAAGYGFSYPSTWDLNQVGSSARLESPGGDTVVSFRSVAADGLGGASEG